MTYPGAVTSGSPTGRPPAWVTSIEKVGASLEGLFSRFAAFGATRQLGPTPVAPGQSTLTSVAVSPPDVQPTSPDQPEDSSSKDASLDSSIRRQNIRLTREADMPHEEEQDETSQSPPPHGSSVDDPGRDDSSSSPHTRNRRVDEEDDSEVIVTLREVKYWEYTVLGQQACPLPAVRRQSLAPILMHRTPDEEPDYSALPLSAFILESLLRHNRAL